MANLISARGFTPEVGENCFIADNARVIGNTHLGKDVSIWYNVTVRGDVASIHVGDETNIQDGSVIHGTFDKYHTVIGKRVTIGHMVMLHGCTIGDNCLIGMGSVIMDDATIPKNCIVGAGSLVTEGSQFEEGMLILGRPARAKRPLTPDELLFLQTSADNYLKYKSWY